MPIRVMLVDDQPMIRVGLKLMIDHERDLTVVGEAANGSEALRLLPAAKPDVVLMDIRMPEMDGIEATRRIVESGGDDGHHPAVLVLTTFEDDEYVFGALRAGAAGFLLKDALPEELLSAIRIVAAGESLIAPAVTGRVVQRWVALESAEATTPASPSTMPDDLGLTGREAEILVGLARGRSNRDLADDLFLSEATVKTHVSSVLAKLGARSRLQAVILAYELGIVVPGDARGLPPP